MRRGRSLKKRRQNIQFTMAPARIANWEYGQATAVPNTLTSIESRYFVTEVQDATKTPDTIINRTLGNVTELLNLAERSWTTNATNADAIVNDQPAGVYDGIHGTLWYKGNDIYTIRNQTNEPVTIQAFWCRCRKDWNQDDGQYQNIYRLLGRGFAERGYDPTNAGAFNQGLVMARISPFDSPLFCRIMKVMRVKKFSIGVGKTHRESIGTKWKKFQPINYVTVSPTATAWASLTPRYDFIRGERFILFKLIGGIGMESGQVAEQYSREIGQTTPLVVMHTQRKYQYKHFWQPAKGLITFLAEGITATDNTVIMADEDEKEMKEAVAE